MESGEVQARFAELIWEKEPISSTELVKLCEKELQWKKSTTYTVLRRLCEQGIFRNENGIVRSLLTKEEFESVRSERFLSENFRGSLPAFLAGFVTRKKLSKEDVEEIQQMIDRYREENAL